MDLLYGQLYSPSVCGNEKVIEKVGGLQVSLTVHRIMILGCVEAVKDEEICHIPKSVSLALPWGLHSRELESKLYAFEAGRSVQAHYERTGIHAEVLRVNIWGCTERSLPEIMIRWFLLLHLNKDHIDLKRCMESIEQKSTYKIIEYIIVENNSTDSATLNITKLEAENWRHGILGLPLITMVHLQGWVSVSA